MTRSGDPVLSIRNLDVRTTADVPKTILRGVDLDIAPVSYTHLRAHET